MSRSRAPTKRPTIINLFQPSPAPTASPSAISPTSFTQQVQGTVDTLASSPFYLAIIIAVIVLLLMFCCLCYRARKRKNLMLRRLQVGQQQQQQRQQARSVAGGAQVPVAIPIDGAHQISVAGGPVRAPPPPDPNQPAPQYVGGGGGGVAIDFAGEFAYFMPPSVDAGAAPSYVAPEYDPPSYNFRSSLVGADPYGEPSAAAQPVSASAAADDAARIEAVRAQAAALELAIAEAEAQARAHEEGLALLEAKAAEDERSAAAGQPIVSYIDAMPFPQIAQQADNEVKENGISNSALNVNMAEGKQDELFPEQPDFAQLDQNEENHNNNEHNLHAEARSPAHYEFDGDADIAG